MKYQCNLKSIAAVAALILACASAAAGEAPPTEPEDLIFLFGGDIIKGKFVRTDGENVIILVTHGGERVEKRIPASTVRRIMRITPGGESKQIFPVPGEERQSAPQEKPKPESPEPPKPVSPEARAQYAKKAAELRKSQAPGEFALGLWCEENGLSNEAKTHFTRAFQLDNSNADYAKKCGYVEVDGALLPPSEAAKAAASKREQEEIDKALRNSEYIRLAGLWISPAIKDFLGKLPDDTVRLEYLTALASLAQRRGAAYDDLPVRERRLIHFLAPQEQKRICPGFDPMRTPPPPERPPINFSPEEMKSSKEGK